MEPINLEIIIRRARRADVPVIVRMLVEDSLGSQRESAADELPASYYQAFDEIDLNDRQMLMVAEYQGEVIGTFQLTFLRYLTYQGGQRAQIEAVRVDQRFRSLGVGRRMMEWAIERARREGCRLVQLTSHKSRTDAHRFYERLGFTASHEGMKLFL